MNIIDYIDWRGDLSFERASFNELDGLIFAEFCFLDLFDIVPTEFSASGVTVSWAVRRFFEIHPEGERLGYIIPEEIKVMAKRMADCARFSGLRLSGFVNRTEREEQRQFCAISVILPDGTVFIAFRGTDDSIVGWREDFNMVFTSPIPSQILATEYVERIASQTDGKIILGGHSKGGNLSLYAASCVSEDIQSRICGVYNYDGPGLNGEIIASEGYQRIKSRITGIIPQASIIGMLFEHEGVYRIVKSRVNGLLQHNGFSWEVMGKSFVTLDSLSRDSLIVNKTVKGIIARMNDEEKKRLVEALFGIFESSNTTSLTELSRNRNSLIKAVLSIPPEHRDIFLKTFMKMVSEGGQAIKSTPRAASRPREASVAGEKPRRRSQAQSSQNGKKQ